MARDCANRRELSGHRNRGAFDFLTKPIDFLDLETIIAKTNSAYRNLA